MTQRFPTAVVLPMALGTTLSPLNSSMIAVALITLMEDFDVSAVEVSWVVSSFYLGAAVGQPVMGGMADRFGPRRVFIIGMAVVALSGVLGPFAPSLAALVAARVLQAVGASAAFPAAVAAIRSLASSQGLDPRSGLSIIATANIGGAAVGPIVGGLAVYLGGWQALFWLNLPIALAAAVLVWFQVSPDPVQPRSAIRAAVIDSDPVGIVLFSVVVVSFLLVVTSLPKQPMYWLLPVGAAGVLAMLWWDQWVAKPFLDIAVLRTNHVLVAVYVHFMLYNVVFYAALYGIPQWLENVHGFSPVRIGLAMSPLAALGGLATPLASRLVTVRGSRFVLVTGSILLCAGSLSLRLFDPLWSVALMFVTCALVGLSYALTNMGLQTQMYAAAAQVGIATGLFQTSRFLGGIISISLVGVAFSEQVDTDALGVVALVAAAIAAALIVFSARRPPLS